MASFSISPTPLREHLVELKANQESPGDQKSFGLKSIFRVHELMTLGHGGSQLSIGKFSLTRQSPFRRIQSLSLSFIKTINDNNQHVQIIVLLSYLVSDPVSTCQSQEKCRDYINEGFLPVELWAADSFDDNFPHFVHSFWLW